MRFLVRHQVFFDIGSGVTSKLLAIINTSILIAAFGERFREKLGLESRVSMVIVVIAAYLIGTYALGIVLDRFGYMEHLAREGNMRNAALRRLEEMSN